MTLIRVGKRVLNLEYMILAEEWDADSGLQLGPGSLRITMETGRFVDVSGPEAEKLRAQLHELCGENKDTGPVPETPMRPVTPPDASSPSRASSRKKRSG